MEVLPVALAEDCLHRRLDGYLHYSGALPRSPLPGSMLTCLPTSSVRGLSSYSWSLSELLLPLSTRGTYLPTA